MVDKGIAPKVSFLTPPCTHTAGHEGVFEHRSATVGNLSDGVQLDDSLEPLPTFDG